MSKARWMVVAWAALACAARNGGSGGDETPRGTASDARQLRASPHCGDATAGATWIGSAERFESSLRDASRESLDGAPRAPNVDFATHGVVRVDMGRRPTGGYSIALADPPFTREGATGSVRVTWTEPAKDAMTTQVLTSPCLFLAVPREGLREVRVVDQGGVERGRAEVR